MRLHPLFAAGVLGLALAARAAAAGPAAPPSPLRLVPAEADVVLHVREPGRLVDLVGQLDFLPALLEFPPIKEQLASTSARRGRQLLAYFEKSLGAKWPDLLDRLAGGGAVLATKLGGGNAPALLVIQGKDEKLLDRFLQLAATVIEGELARQESKDKLEKGDYHGVPGFKVGSGLWLARAGAALVVSNKKEALARALDLHRGKDKNSMADHPPLREAGTLLPGSPLLRAWLNMRPIQKGAGAKELYKSPRDNAFLTVVFGGYLDVLGRTPFVCAGLYHDDEGYCLRVRAPRGRDGMGADRDLHLPPAGQPGTLPLLEPKGVLYSASFYRDIARIWKDRDKLFPKAQAKGLADADKNAPLGIKFSALLESVGARHRLVVANQAKPGYTKRSQVTIPAFAFIPELRKADRFARTMDTVLRTGALALTNQFEMKLTEEKHGGVDIVGYRFDEKKELKDDVNDIRFAFSPCWARVGDCFVFSSTIELCRDLVDQLQAQQKSPGKGLSSSVRERYYATGFADLLAGIQDQLVTQAILDQAADPEEAKKQVRQFIRLIGGLGSLKGRSDFGDKTWTFEYRYGK